MREFNIFGPMNPQRHYHVNRVDVKQELQGRIHRGRYMTDPTRQNHPRLLDQYQLR